MRAPSHRRRVGANPLAAAVTPMIDVVFLLLVFFLCTASFEPPEQNLAASLVVASPQSGSGADELPPELERVTIVGAREGATTRWTANASRSTSDLGQLASLLAELAAIDSALPVTIDAGPAVPMADVVGAYDAARSAGFSRVQLAADALREEAP